MNILESCDLIVKVIKREVKAVIKKYRECREGRWLWEREVTKWK